MKLKHHSFIIRGTFALKLSKHSLLFVCFFCCMEFTDYDERVLPSIVNEVTKAVVAKYNASELLTKREVSGWLVVVVVDDVKVIFME